MSSEHPSQHPQGISQHVARLLGERPRMAAIRAEIEMAALELYSQRGAENVTTDDIAERAGVSRRTLFRYCPTKDDVLAGLFAKAFLHHIMAFRDRPAEEEPADAWIAVIAESKMWRSFETRELTHHLVVEQQGLMEDAMDRAVRLASPLLVEAVDHRLSQSGADRRQALAVSLAIMSVNRAVFIEWIAGGQKGIMAEHLAQAFDAVCLALKPRIYLS